MNKITTEIIFKGSKHGLLKYKSRESNLDQQRKEIDKFLSDFFKLNISCGDIYWNDRTDIGQAHFILTESQS